MAACIDDDQPPPTFKHYCRVCKKGFMCGRALGGHMRAHGIGDENGALDDDDEDDDDNSDDWEDRNTTNCKRMYQLRTNPNRLKSCRTCDNCGKEFLSWKSFLEHENLGKCTSDDAASDSDDGEKRWSKRKRSLRSKVGSEDDLLLATCLVQLANTTVDLPLAEPEESCKSRDQKTKGLFECKACKKVFNSHQALGGHRASHKKVKGCYAAKQDESDDNNVASSAIVDVANNDQEFFPSSKPTFQFEQPLVGAGRWKSKVHECSICHRVFNSGQALGGHKRCHWIISNSPETSSMPKFQFQLQDQNVDPVQKHQHHHHHHHHKPIINAQVSEKLDLNVPAWAQMAGVRRDPQNPLSFDVSTETNLRAAWVGKGNGPGGNTMNGDGKMNKEKSGSEKEREKEKEKEKEKGEGEGEDEADSKLKLAKLSVLNDTNVGSSQWLQVGIGSATEAAAAADGGGGDD